MSIDWSNLNYMAIIAGGLLYMVYGGIYYSVLLSGKKEIQSNRPFKYIYSVIIAFINSFLVAILIQVTAADSLLQGAAIGFIIGIIITMVYVKNALFGLISKKSLLIAIGDHLIIFTLLGVLHCCFQ
ncbi:DUF1761 domain-containing protein [Psychrobacillus sp. OK032]|uniref:DUF1761 domain-containing protein n=1 Tax=Psychrobacillus sp. OK032 TaxID=1884358 RepID=UPI0008C7F03F|nr:DUF1761 domain-containing protein [Psychrobacillus sp. OK032]SES04006.1 Protein of unknown function [Psychrobacillus sp. OK032]